MSWRWRPPRLPADDLAWLFQDPIVTKPDGYGVSLPLVYVLWLGISAGVIPTLPLVCSAQAAAPRLVAKLSLSHDCITQFILEKDVYVESWRFLSESGNGRSGYRSHRHR